MAEITITTATTLCIDLEYAINMLSTQLLTSGNLSAYTANKLSDELDRLEFETRSILTRLRDVDSEWFNARRAATQRVIDDNRNIINAARTNPIR